MCPARPELPFKHAIVRLACLTSKGQKPQLVFACVEMLPAGRAAPDDAPLDADGHPPGLRTKAGWLAFRRIGLPAVQALEWYRTLDTLPDKTGPHRSVPLSHGELVDEPGWANDFWSALAVPLAPPVLPGPMDDDRMDPFVGANREAVRVHRRFATSSVALDGLLSLPPDKRAAAFEWLRLRSWVDFDHYPELLGAAVLVVPDPNLRTVDSKLERAENGQEAVRFDVTWRHVPAPEMRLVVRERRYGTLVRSETFDVPAEGTVRTAYRQPIGEISWEMIHPTRGLVASQPMTGFMRAVTLDSNILGRKVTLCSTDGRGKTAPESRRSVQDVSHERTTTGTPLFPPGRLAEGREHRRNKRHVGTEFWLDDPTVARDTLWDLIGDAHEGVLLVDPYADGKDLQDYGMASSGAPVRLLTAGKKNAKRDYIPVEAGLAAMVKARKCAKAKVKKTIPHDRFIVLDKTVWLLGASLNGLGQEPTMLIRLRESKPVLERLESFWGSLDAVEIPR